MGIWLTSTLLFALFPLVLFSKGTEWRKTAWYPLLWFPIALFTILPAIVAFGDQAQSNRGKLGPGDGVPALIPIAGVVFLIWIIYAIVLIIHRPRQWNLRFSLAGITVFAVLQFLQHSGRTESIEVLLYKPDETPWGHLAVEHTAINLIGQKTKKWSRSDDEGRLTILVPKKESFGLRIASTSFKNATGNRNLHETGLYVERNSGAYPTDHLSSSWKIPRGPRGEDVHQSIKLHLPKGTPIKRIPWIIGTEDQAFEIDNSKLWIETWPNGRLEIRCWKTLANFDSIIEPYRSEHPPEHTTLLPEVAADLVEIREIAMRITSRPTQLDERDYLESDQFLHALCESLLGRDPGVPAERSRLLGEFVDQRLHQLMELIRPWMSKNDRLAYQVIREMGHLARPLTSEYASAYPLLDANARGALRWTLGSVGPDPRDVLFLLDDPDERVASDFFDALRSPTRPRSWLEGDLKVFHQWAEENPNKFTESMKGRLQNAIRQRQDAR